MLEKKVYEGKLYLEGVLFPAWGKFEIRSTVNEGISASFDALDHGMMRNQILAGTKVHFFIKNTGFAWVERENVPVGEFFLCFDGIITGFNFTSHRGQQMTITCEGNSYFSKISKFFYSYEVLGDASLNEKNSLDKITDIANEDNYSSIQDMGASNFQLNTAEDGGQSDLVDNRFYSNVHEIQQFLDNRAAIFFEKILQLKKYFITEEVAIEGKEETRNKIVLSKEEIDLGNMFRYFIHRFSQDGKTEEVVKEKRPFFFLHDKFVSSAMVEENTAVVGTKISPGEEYLGGTDSLLYNDLFQSGLRQALNTLPTLDTSLFGALNYMLSVFNYQFVEMPFPSLKVDDGFSEIIFKPNLFVTMPPWCNVLFENDVVSSGGGRVVGYEPNRCLLLSKPWRPAELLGATQTEKPFKDLTQEEKQELIWETRKQKQIEDIFSNQSSNLSYTDGVTSIDALDVGLSKGLAEDLFVPIPFFEDADDFRNFFYDTHLTSEDMSFDYFRERVKHNFWRAYYGSRRFSCSLNFSPFLLCGHSSVVFEKYYATVGDIYSVSHRFSPEGHCSTSIELTKPRWVDYHSTSYGDGPNEEVKFHTPDYMGSKATEVYDNLFGSVPFVEMEVNDSASIKTEIDKKIKETAIKFKEKNLKEYNELFNLTYNKKRSRRFVSEKTFFTSLTGASLAEVEAKIEAEHFDSFVLEEIGKGKPFGTERQNIIKAWKDSLKQFGVIRREK